MGPFFPTASRYNSKGGGDPQVPGIAENRRKSKRDLMSQGTGQDSAGAAGSSLVSSQKQGGDVWCRCDIGMGVVCPGW